MGRSQETFHKKEVRSKKEKKRKEKEAKKLARKESSSGGGLDAMMAYVDENGQLSDTPPDPNKKKVVNKLEDSIISTPKQENVSMEDSVRKGAVTFFNDSKGFGFIKDSETQESVFVHVNNILEDITENNVVSFEVEMGQKGPIAVQVKLVR